MFSDEFVKVEGVECHKQNGDQVYRASGNQETEDSRIIELDRAGLLSWITERTANSSEGQS